MYQFGADDSTMHGTWVDGTITEGTWVFKVRSEPEFCLLTACHTDQNECMSRWKRHFETRCSNIYHSLFFPSYQSDAYSDPLSAFNPVWSCAPSPRGRKNDLASTKDQNVFGPGCECFNNIARQPG